MVDLDETSHILNAYSVKNDIVLYYTVLNDYMVTADLTTFSY